MKKIIQWKAYYKHGLCNQTIVYAETENEARKQAFAEYRKTRALVDDFTMDFVIESVVPVL